MRVAAVGDVHCTTRSSGQLQGLFGSVGSRADVLLLCGDLTQEGRPEEARVLAGELKAADVPVLAVLGNHDFEADAPQEVTDILEAAGVVMLDGRAWEKDGVGFAGVKGFGGGFGEGSLAPWGEPTLKRFVEETIAEALKLERALASLRTERRVALMHYAPIAATIAGEPTEIWPYLGSSRLEEPLDRYQVRATFHGHAHRGTLEGRTRGGRPVYNVALPLMLEARPELPILVIDLDAAESYPRVDP
jgi:Icc-related predicted phosphoesterase